MHVCHHRGLKDLKTKHYGVLQEQRTKQPLPKFASNALHSPKRGKIRPKSAPTTTAAVAKKPEPLAYNDKYDERPRFSKVELDRIVKTNLRNNAAKKSGNKALKDTADFATKMQQWGKTVAHGEKSAKQTSKKQQEVAHKAVLEADIEHLLARQGADTTKSLQRIRSYNAKEDKARSEMDLQVYNETMTNLLNLFDSLNRANTICMGRYSNIRYEVHHKQTEEDVAFWSLAKKLIKSYKKETSFMAMHDDHPELGMRGQEHNANHYHSQAQLERHTKMGQELLHLGCGKRMANVFIEELQYSDNVVIPSNSTGMSVAERTSSNVTVKRLVSLEKFQNVVLRELIANSFSGHNRNNKQHGYEATTTTSAIHNVGTVTVKEKGREDLWRDSDGNGIGAGVSAGTAPRVHFGTPPGAVTGGVHSTTSGIVAFSATSVGGVDQQHYAEEDVAYYSNHVLNHEGGGWNNIVSKMKQYQSREQGQGAATASTSMSTRHYVSHTINANEHMAATLRPTEVVLMNVIQNTLNARKLVEHQLAELQENRGWNLPHVPPRS